MMSGCTRSILKSLRNISLRHKDVSIEVAEAIGYITSLEEEVTKLKALRNISGKELDAYYDELGELVKRNVRSECDRYVREAEAEYEKE